MQQEIPDPEPRLPTPKDPHPLKALPSPISAEERTQLLLGPALPTRTPLQLPFGVDSDLKSEPLVEAKFGEMTSEMYPEPELPPDQLKHLREQLRVKNARCATGTVEQFGYPTSSAGSSTPPKPPTLEPLPYRLPTQPQREQLPQQDHTINNYLGRCTEPARRPSLGAQWPPLPPPPRQQFSLAHQNGRAHASNQQYSADIDEELSYLSPRSPTPTPPTPTQQSFRAQLQQPTREQRKRPTRVITPASIPEVDEQDDNVITKLPPPPPMPARRRPSMVEQAPVRTPEQITPLERTIGIDEQSDYLSPRFPLLTPLKELPSPAHQTRTNTPEFVAKFDEEQAVHLTSRNPRSTSLSRQPSRAAQQQEHHAHTTSPDYNSRFDDDEAAYLTPRAPPPTPTRQPQVQRQPPVQRQPSIQSQPPVQSQPPAVQRQPPVQQYQQRQPKRQPLCYQPSGRPINPVIPTPSVRPVHGPSPVPTWAAGMDTDLQPVDRLSHMTHDEKMAYIDEFLNEEDCDGEVARAGVGPEVGNNGAADEMIGDAMGEGSEMVSEAMAELDKMLRELDSGGRQ